MTDAEYQEALVQVRLWVKHPGPSLPGQKGSVEQQKIKLPRSLVRELLKRAGAL